VTRRHILLLVALSLIWGASFMFIKVAVRELDPFALAWLRLALAAVVLVPVALVVIGRRGLDEGRSALGRLTLLGLVNSAIPFFLIAWAETSIDSGLTAILQAAAPIFTVLISVRLGAERVTGFRLAGVLCGFAGVALLVGIDGRGSLLASLAVVAAAFGYAFGGVFTSRSLAQTDPLVIGAGSLAMAAVLSTPLGVTHLPADVPGWKTIASVIVLGVAGTAVAYVLYFALLRGTGPSRAILTTYLVPAVAVVYGVVLLDEPLTAAAVGGLGLILGGVALAGRRSRPAAIRATRRPTLDS
jgi:drug/metabolite transporter (DMT)-like permease